MSHTPLSQMFKDKEAERLRAELDEVMEILGDREKEISGLRAEVDRLRELLTLARNMFLDMQRGIQPSRVDFEKIVAALEGKDAT